MKFDDILQREKTQRMPSYQWQQLRQECFERDGHACVQCGSRDNLEADHIVPVSLGGLNVLSNLQTLCAKKECHKEKTKTDNARYNRIQHYKKIQKKYRDGAGGFV